jgi:hypothetical protein
MNSQTLLELLFALLALQSLQKLQKLAKKIFFEYKNLKMYKMQNSKLISTNAEKVQANQT